MTAASPTPNSVEQNLSSSYVPKGNLPNLPATGQIQEALKKKEAEKIKKDIDKFAEKVKKQFKFVDALGICPQQASGLLEKEYEISEADSKKELVHLLMVVPESKFKQLQKIKLDVIKLSKEVNDKFWVHIVTPIDFWNFGLDSKFDVFEAFAMSYPLIDKKGFLAAVRVSQVHKSLVLRKFEKYVTSYGMFGSLVRGEIKKESDIDVVVIIDDTDVKRMNRYELIEKLRGIILSYVSEAMGIAGAKVDFNVQVWLLTDFWERVKDAEPVAFTFIRDGIPLYDRGAFLPWKSLLRMGRIKPSPESVDMFMMTGDKMKDQVDRKVFDILIHDIYWGVMHPTQGMLMLYGLAPQNVYDTVKSFRETFVEKEKILEKKYADIFEEIAIKYYKGFEHGKVKPGDIKGTDIDRLFKNSTDYIARLKELRSQIERRVKENDMEQIYKNVFTQLEAILGKKKESDLIKEFEAKFIKEGKFPPRFLENLKLVAKVYSDVKKAPAKPAAKKKAAKKGSNSNKDSEKASSDASFKLRKEVDNARKKASELTNALIEYTQRADFLSLDRARFVLKGKDKSAEVFFLKDTYVVSGPQIQKVKGKKLADADPQEFEKELLDSKGKENVIDFTALEVIKSDFGDFDLVY